MNTEAFALILGIIVGGMFGAVLATINDPFFNFQSNVDKRGFIIYNDEVYIVKKVPHDRFVQGNHTIDSNR
jgi:hypothetical protein